VQYYKYEEREREREREYVGGREGEHLYNFYLTIEKNNFEKTRWACPMLVS
jgi:hypothetical protein